MAKILYYFKLMALVLTCYMITIKMQKISLVFMKNIRQVYIVTRTIYPHTAHFFKFFYSGKSKVKNFDQTLQKNRIDFSKSFESNLIRSLQDVDVNFKYLTYHRAAVPEGTDFGVKNYKGLRSYYLTEKCHLFLSF